MGADEGFETRVVDHYLGTEVLDRIRQALIGQGVDPDRLTVEQTSSFDEFHIGGAEATAYVLGKMDIQAGDCVLDVGCGIGGPARHIASATGCHVTGIDLTPGYIDASAALSRATGMGESTSFDVGNGLEMSYEDGRFDVAVSFHVSMNIEDRTGLYREIHRVLVDGGAVCLYDILKGNAPGPIYPVPWAASSETSFLWTIAETCEGLEKCGFDIEYVEDRSSAAGEFFAKMANQAKSNPNPLGLNLITGEHTKTLFGNLRASLGEGSVKPVLILARKRAG